MKTISRLTLIAGLACASAAIAHAHPGHGEIGTTHYITSPQHFGWVIAASVGLVFLVLTTRRQGRRFAKV